MAMSMKSALTITIIMGISSFTEVFSKIGIQSSRDTSQSAEAVTQVSISQTWRKAHLAEHNILRRKHGVPNLQQDPKLDELAQKYAEYLASKNLFDHSQDNEYGENLMLTSTDDEVEAVRDAVSSWYEEIKDYDFNKAGYKEETSHFTTMMWKATTHVGVGVAWNPKEEQFVVVANYNPGGNVDGEYSDNVLPVVSDLDTSSLF